MRRLSWTIAAVMLLLGLFDLLLRWHYFRNLPAVVLALHDPAKTLVHVFLAPLAAFLLLEDYPVARVRLAFQTPKFRRVLLVLALVLAAIAAAFAAHNAYVGFVERLPMPEDVAAQDVRDPLFEVRKAYIRSAASAPALAASYAALTPKNRKFAEASARAYISAVLTFSAFLLVAGVIWTFWLFALLQTPLEEVEGFLHRLLMSIAILSPWVVLQPYSEWHFHFGEVQPGRLPPLILAGIFLLGVIVLVVYMKSPRNVSLWTSGIVTSVSTLAAVIAAVNKQWFETAASIVNQATSGEVLLLYLLPPLLVTPVLLFGRARHREA